MKFLREGSTVKKTAIKDIDHIIYRFGRTYQDTKTEILYFNWTCSGLELTFRGNCLIASLHAQPGIEVERDVVSGNMEERAIWPWVSVFLDDEEVPCRRFEISKPEDTQLIFQSEKEEIHRIRIVKITENLKTGLGIDCFFMEGEILQQERRSDKRKIEFIGDSITCGFGNETKEKDRLFYSDEENGWLSHAAIAARKLEMDWSMICVSGICLGKRKIIPLPYAMNELYPYTDRILEDRLGRKTYQAWDFASHAVDYIVLNLGTNDATGIIGGADSEQEEKKFHKEYYEFLKMLRQCNGADTRIICALGSMDYYLYHEITEIVTEYRNNTGDCKVTYFRYPKIDFMDPLGACAHPYVITHEKMAEALIQYIEGLERT